MSFLGWRLGRSAATRTRVWVCHCLGLFWNRVLIDDRPTANKPARAAGGNFLWVPIEPVPNRMSARFETPSNPLRLRDGTGLPDLVRVKLSRKGTRTSM